MSADISQLIFYLFKAVYQILLFHDDFGLIYGLMIFEVMIYMMVLFQAIEKIKLFQELLLIILQKKFPFFIPQLIIFFNRRRILRSVYLYFQNYLTIHAILSVSLKNYLSLKMMAIVSVLHDYLSIISPQMI